MEYIHLLFEPEVVVTTLASIAAFATILTLGMPYMVTDRLAPRFPDFTSELFEGVNHLFTSHQAQPERTAELLRAFWARAERETAT